MGRGNLAVVASHSDISIDEIKRRRIVRQDRIFLTEHEVFFSYHEKSSRVFDCTAFGIAIISDLDCEEEFINGKLCAHDVHFGDIHLKKVRSEKTEGGFKIAFAVIGEPIDVAAIGAYIDVKAAIEESIDESKKHHNIPESFQWKVNKLKFWIESLERSIQKVERKGFDTRRDDLAHFEDVTCAFVARHIDQSIQPYFQEIATEFSSVEKEKRAECLAYFREALGTHFYQSYYAHRAFSKPRGYAGDFEMMNTVYMRENRGNTLFAKCLHRYFVEVPEAQAVRNRADFLEVKVVDVLTRHRGESAKLMSLACGPAMEMQNSFKKHPELFGPNVEIHFVDQDEEALKTAQRELETIARANGVQAKLIFHNTAIKNVIEKGFPQKDFDLIYSAGLFDYFSDPVSFFAAKQMLSCLRAGGQLVIGNFNVNIPNQFGMVAIMDWHLIYRSEADLLKLYGGLGKVEIEKEKLGINLFAIISR